MKLVAIEIDNFRAFEHAIIYLDGYNCIIGRNNSGKSTVLTALNVFFRNSSAPGVDVTRLFEEDFYDKDTARTIRIQLTFGQLSDDAKRDFAPYVRHGQLVLSAIANWSDTQECAPVEQHGSRLVNKDFADFFEHYNDNSPVAELRASYNAIRETYTDLPNVTVKSQMYEALRQHEESAPDICTLIEESNYFYGWSKGANLLRRYVDWLYVPAVKDATEEEAEGRQTAIGQLVRATVRRSEEFDQKLKILRERTENEYATLVESEDDSLISLNERLTQRFSQWGYNDLGLDVRWSYEPGRTVQVGEPFARIRVSDGTLNSSIGRIGHGLQRALILSLLEELSDSATERGEGFTPIVAIEEPELYQHPPQARHLREVLTALGRGNATVLVTTHNPIFVDSKGFEGLRRTEKQVGNTATIRGISADALGDRLATIFGGPEPSTGAVIAGLANELNPNLGEMFFCDRLVLVEGVEDLAFITSLLSVTGRYEEFRRIGGHVVPAMGKMKLIRPMVVAQEAGIDLCVMFDADQSKGDDGRIQTEKLCRGLGLDEVPELPYLTCDALIWPETLADWLKREIGEGEWDSAMETARHAISSRDAPGQKNVQLIGHTIETLSKNNSITTSIEDMLDRTLGK